MMLYRRGLRTAKSVGSEVIRIVFLLVDTAWESKRIDELGHRRSQLLIVLGRMGGSSETIVRAMNELVINYLTS